MAKTFVALKRFGGGRKLRELYGRGTGRLVPQGAEIKEEHLPNSLRTSLEGLGLIEQKEKGKTYRAQADRNMKARNKRERDAKEAKKAATEKPAEKKAKG